MDSDRAVTPHPRPLGRGDATVALALVAATAVIGAIYAWLGPGYVLDDWFTLGNGRVDGIVGTPGHAIFVNRPGAGLLYCLQFGILAGHPLPALVVLTALSSATAVLLYLLARRFVSPATATAIAFVWVALPNHTSLEFWLSCTPLAAAVVLLLCGALRIARPQPTRRQWAEAVALFTVASLTYEAVLPAAVLVAMAAPALASGRWIWGRAIRAGCLLAPAAVYVVVFRSSQKRADKLAPLWQMAPAHFGWGIVPSGPGASVLLALAMLAGVVCLARLVLPGFRSSTGLGERLIAAGAVVIVVGTLPFAFYLYAPLGAGDRFDLVSAMGGAAVWVGLGLVAWRWRALAVAAAFAIALAVTTARVQRTETWTTAVADGKRIVATVRARFPQRPDVPVVLGPAPIQRTNIAAFLDQSNVSGMLRYEYAADVPGGMAFNESEFERFPAEGRFDVRSLSNLEPDVDLRTR